MLDLTARIKGVTFDSLRMALVQMYFRPKTHDECMEALNYVIPMQHNFEKPLDPKSKDTYIQYWINSDERITQDYSQSEINTVEKIANCSLRFLGAKAEMFAKSFHHLTKRQSCASIFTYYCNGNVLEYISPITVRNMDYYGAGNTTKAFTIIINIQYEEQLDFSEDLKGIKPLKYVNMVKGEIK